MNEYILSICIPTYNRCNLLKESLDNLINQIMKMNYKIEICVSDNCSTDCTAVLLNEYQQKFPFLKININQFNCGYDYNLCRAINMAIGTYIWTLSDDDIVLDYSIEYITSLILKYTDIKTSVIFVKPQFEKKDIIYTVMEEMSSNSRVLTENIIKNSDDILIHVNWLVSFVSAFVIRKEYIGDNLSRFIGTGFIHTPMILNCIKKGNAIVTNNSHILCRQNNSGGYNIYKYFGTNIASIFNFYKENKIFYAETIDKVVTEWLRCCVLGNVIYCKLNRNKSFEHDNNIADLLIPYRKNKFFIYRVLPILILPNWLLQIISKWRGW